MSDTPQQPKKPDFDVTYKVQATANDGYLLIKSVITPDEIVDIEIYETAVYQNAALLRDLFMDAYASGLRVGTFKALNKVREDVNILEKIEQILEQAKVLKAQKPGG